MRDPWLPIGFRLSTQALAGPIQDAGYDWQIVATTPFVGAALLIMPELATRWSREGYLECSLFEEVCFGTARWKMLLGGPNHLLAWLPNAPPPESKSEALSFALALNQTRAINRGESLGDAIFVERYSRLLPTYSNQHSMTDDRLLGWFLSAGVDVSCLSLRRIEVLAGWMPPAAVREVIQAANLGASDHDVSTENAVAGSAGQFRLLGRPGLERFFIDHVIDIAKNEDRYKSLGIGFPSALVLHGPPGCGKTYAVQRLTEHLGWKCFEVNCATIGSPFIHETGKRISEVFERARAAAPCAVVIDEMEAFLSSRDTSTSGHHIEEVAEFLRRIPEARENRVLVVGMTNRIDLIDPAVLRRGRFDHVLEVSLPTSEEIEAVLESLFATLPHDPHLPLRRMAESLGSCPLSDVSFVVREAARLAAKSGLTEVGTAQLQQALVSAKSKPPAKGGRRIGFAPS